MKKVMIALDYDSTAQKVAEKGFLLAKTLKAKVTLMHVVADEPYYSSMHYYPIMSTLSFSESGDINLKSDEELTTAAISFLEKSKNNLGDNSINISVGKGDFTESILQSAKKLEIDIIVIGSHCQKWLEYNIMRSVEEVSPNSNIPLFIIPTEKLN